MAVSDPVNEAPKRVRLTSASKMKRFRSVIKMNWRSLAGINPVLMGMLGQTTVAGSFTHIVLDTLDDDGVELSMRAAQAGEEGALELAFSKSGRTAEVLLSLMTAEWPGLRVPKGRLRSFPVALRTDDLPPYLVLNLKESSVEPAPGAKQSSD